MSRRWTDMRIVRHQPTDGETIGVWLSTAIGVLLLLLAIALAAPYARAHEWLSGKSNPAGELCCGDYDCGVMVAGKVKAVRGGYEVDAVFRITYQGKVTDDHVREFWPLQETTPSPDGAYWRCKRPDGTTRCKFVPPPGS